MALFVMFNLDQAFEVLSIAVWQGGRGEKRRHSYWSGKASLFSRGCCRFHQL